MAQRKLQQMERLRGAFGLRDVKEGEAFDPEAVAARREAEKAARQEERVKREAEREVRSETCSGLLRIPKGAGRMMQAWRDSPWTHEHIPIVFVRFQISTTCSAVLHAA